MYLQHFSLTGFPFEASVPVTQLFESAAQAEAEARIKLLVDVGGIGMITGEAGSGKSTVCRAVAHSLHDGLYRVMHVSLTTGSVLDTLNMIGTELGLPPVRRRADVWRIIRQELERMVTEKKLTPVLVVDEAHHLQNAALEELRLVSSFDFDSTQHLRLLLVGLTPLRRRIAMAAHESLCQRLVVQHHFSALTMNETAAYVQHRMQVAGGADIPYFRDNAIELMHRHANGMPRLVNRLAHHALTAAATDNQHQVELRHMQQAYEELQI